MVVIVVVMATKGDIVCHQNKSIQALRKKGGVHLSCILLLSRDGMKGVLLPWSGFQLGWQTTKVQEQCTPLHYTVSPNIHAIKYYIQYMDVFVSPVSLLVTGLEVCRNYPYTSTPTIQQKS